MGQQEAERWELRGEVGEGGKWDEVSSDDGGAEVEELDKIKNK